MKRVADRNIIEQLQKQILLLQGQKQAESDPALQLGIGAMESVFPGGVFPRGAIHELISTSSEEATCTSAFISVLLGRLIQNKGYCLWISTVPRRSIFPSALQAFGIDPGRILFVDAGRPKETLWAIEEALKCDALLAVVGEITELSFNDSRRLQLAVERSKVTGFIHRFRPKTENAVACISRWKISPLPSTGTGQPGLGFSSWQVKLLKVRSGQPAQWQVQWSPQGLDYLLPEKTKEEQAPERQIG